METTIENIAEPVRSTEGSDRRQSGVGNRRNRRTDNKGVIIQPDSLASPDVTKSVSPDVVIIGDPAQSNPIDNSQSKDETMTQASETQVNHNQQTEGESKMQETQVAAKPSTAFESMMKARLAFEKAKTDAIIQVRQLVEDWQIDIRKDVFPESIKARKPYAKRKPKEGAAMAPSSVQSGTAAPTPSADGVKAPEPALV